MIRNCGAPLSACADWPTASAPACRPTFCTPRRADVAVCRVQTKKQLVAPNSDTNIYRLLEAQTTDSFPTNIQSQTIITAVAHHFASLPDFSLLPLWTGFTVLMEGAASPAARKVCHSCHVEKPLDQFYNRRGNGRVVADCLDCRDRRMASVRMMFLIPFHVS